MQVRYYKLVGMEVVASNGKRLGRVADLEATAQAETLRVTALLIGPRALVSRISNLHSSLLRRVLPPSRVPWDLIASIDRQVRLTVTREELCRSAGDSRTTGADEP